MRPARTATRKPLGLLNFIFGRTSKPLASTHEAAGTGRRLRAWLPWDSSPRREHMRLALLRARARDAYRNNAIARAAIDRMTSDFIGTGVSPKPMAKSEDVRMRLIDSWEAWSLECDADGQTDFYGLQTLALHAMFESGEVLALLEPDDATGIPLKIRLIESDHLPFKNETLSNGHRIIDGIELDKRGRRVAYWLHPNHPGDLNLTNNDPVRVEAHRVLHLFEATRPGQLRGVPVLAPVLVRLKDLDEFDDAQLIRQKIANLFVGFITRPAPDPLSQPLGPDNQPLPAEPSEQPALEFEPGLLQELNDGEDVTFSEPPGAPSGYREFTRAQLHIVSAALGLPYPFLTGDYSDINDRVVRVAINEYKRRAMALIRNVLVPKFCEPIRRAWVDAAVLAGELPTNQRDLKLTRWTPHGWAYIQPVQDIQADVLAINNKLKSRSEALLERGYDAELIDREIAADLAREQALGLPPSPAATSAVPPQETAPQEPKE
ncbi:phage portal protein [Castellaniella sp.]|uniref:phage portal protein n=1 Tax=Castellaniella sp. TaxID=1955812 RepID=UPI002AFE0B95|nr:phage portal protein [Castellaniella sp.]